MAERRWFNPHQPQTLQIGVMLLYLTGFFAVLRGLAGESGGLFWFATVALAIYGAWGTANEQRTGYYAAVAASLLPFGIRLVYFGVQGLLFADIFTIMIQVALVALLLHPMSTEYQKIWFK